MNKDYVYQQTIVGLSHESENQIWSEGQRRYIKHINKFLAPESRVFDCACGDGIGIIELNKFGHFAMGMDMSDEKLQRAGKFAYKGDMHNINDFREDKWDAVLSSHTLEHAYDPGIVIDNFYKVLNDSGLLFIVLPFPDPGDWNNDIHVGKYILGTDGNDTNRVVSFFTDRGFTLIESMTDNYREPELWLVFKKRQL